MVARSLVAYCLRGNDDPAVLDRLVQNAAVAQQYKPPASDCHQILVLRDAERLSDARLEHSESLVLVPNLVNGIFADGGIELSDKLCVE